MMRNEADDPPTFLIEEIVEIVDESEVRNTGFVAARDQQFASKLIKGCRSASLTLIEEIECLALDAFLRNETIERIGVAQIEPESDLGCQDLIGCKNKQTCGMKGSPNG